MYVCVCSCVHACVRECVCVSFVYAYTMDVYKALCYIYRVTNSNFNHSLSSIEIPVYLTMFDTFLIILNCILHFAFRYSQSKEEGKDKGLIQSNTTHDPGHHIGK